MFKDYGTCANRFLYHEALRAGTVVLLQIVVPQQERESISKLLG